MGVYIKGMDMPKNCESCQFRRCISDLIMFSWVGCQLDVGMAKKESFKGRHPDCPLVEVKEPHGRLIDTDAIGYAGIEKAAYDSLLIVKEQNKLCEDLELLERANGRLDGVLRITSKLRFAPTIIPAEEG